MSVESEEKEEEEGKEEEEEDKTALIINSNTWKLEDSGVRPLKF